MPTPKVKKSKFAFMSYLEIDKEACNILQDDFRTAIQKSLDSLTDEQIEEACIELESETPHTIKVNGRGFPYLEFRDRYQVACSMRKSSLATQDAIWFGVDDPAPKIMASLASKHGVKTDKTTGWVNYPIPEDVHLNTSMHLTREDVIKLLPRLILFAKTGEIG